MKLKRILPLTAFLIGGFTSSPVSLTYAASVDWDANGGIAPNPAGGTGTWDVNTTANWWDGAANVAWPVLGGMDDDAVFGYTAGTVTLAAGGITANDLTFSTTGYLITGNTLTLNGSTAIITTNATVTATIGSLLAGSANLSKAGDGILVLSGANTGFTGKTTIAAGVISIAADTALGNAPGAAVADQLTLNGGTLRITATGQTLNANRGITLGASGGTFDTSTITGSAITTTIGGIIAGNGPLTLKSTGNMSASGGGEGGLGIKLNQATNTFTGDVTITSGLVSYADNLSFGDAANKIILNGGGLLDPNTNIALSRDIQILAGGGTFRGYGSLNVTWSGAITGSGPINRTDGGTLTLAGDLSGYFGTYSNQGGTTVLTGTVATIPGTWIINGGNLTVKSTANQTFVNNLSGGGSFTKDAAGTLTLFGTNNYTNGTTITAGIIRQGVTNALPLGRALTVNGTSVFDLNGLDSSISTLAGVATGIVTDTAAGTGTSTLTLTAAGGSSSVIIKDGATRTVALRVTNGLGAFVLSNALNTFSGGIVLTNGVGGTRMSTGTIVAGSYGTGAITVGEAATDYAGIFLNTANQTLENPIISNTNLGTDRVGTFRVDAIGMVLSGQLTANLAPMTFSTNGTGAVSATGKITGPNGLMLLANPAIASSLVVTISNSANDYAGDTTINQSPISARTNTLTLGAANVIPNGSGKGNVVINTNGSGIGRLNLGGFSDTINGLSGNGTVDGVSGTPTLTLGDNNTTSTFTGTIVNAAGSLAVVKTGSGTQSFSGASTYSGGTSVNVGTLIVTGPSSLGTNSGLTVANNATLAYQPTAAGSLNLGSGALNFASGSRIVTALGGTAGQSAITSSAAAVTVAGPVMIDVYGITGVEPATGANNVITAGSGLNNATYSLGNVYNANNFTITGISQSATAVSVTVSTATPLIAQYWKGGFSGGNNVWSISDGTSASNWASDAIGTNTSLTPNSASTVIFSATGASNQSAMVLGNDMNIGGIVVNDTNAVTLNADIYSLTLGAGGIAINSGAGAVTLGATLVTSAPQTWANASANPLTIGNSVNTSAGAITLSAGTLKSGSTTAFGNNTVLVLNNAAGVAMDITGFDTTVGSITGGGAAGGNIILGAATLTTGGNNAITTFSGVLSGAGGGFTKLGTGILTLAGAASNTHTGVTTVNQGAMTLSKTGGATALGGNLTFDNNLSPDVYTTVDNQFASGAVVSFVTNSGDHGRLDLMGTTQTVAGIQTVGYTALRGVIQNSEAIANTGTSTLVLNGAGSYSFTGYLRSQTGVLGLTKSGSGTQALSGTDIRYSGATTVSAGTLQLVNTTNFGSPINNTATVEFNTTAGANFGTAVALSGSGTYNKTGAAIMQFTGTQAITATGKFNIQVGTLQNNGNFVNWSGNKADIDVNSAAILDLYADPVFLDVLTGTGTVQNNFGNNLMSQSGSVAYFEQLVVGMNNGTGTFAGLIRNNSGDVIPASGANNGGLELVKVGTGTQGLTGTNTYTGSTSVFDGTLQLDFATGGTTNIIAPTSALVLAGGILEIKGGSGEADTQTFGGISGTGKLLLTQNGATSINVSLGAVNTSGGKINFAGSDATVGALGNLNFLTTTTTTGNDGTARLGAHLWNGTDWASTSATGGNHVVKWVGTYSDLTTDGNDVTNPMGELRVIDGAASGTAATYGADTTAASLLMTATTYSTTLDLGSNVLTLGNGAGALGVVAVSAGTQALTIGATPGQGFLTAGTSAAASNLALNNESSSTLTINSVIRNNAATGVVSLVNSGNTALNGVNTYSGTTTIAGGTLTIGAAGSLGSGTYAGLISNSGSLVYASSASQTLSGAISGAGMLTMNGNSTLTLSGANTAFTGPINVTTGTLTLGSATGLGATPMVTVASGGTLDLAGLASGRPVTIRGTGVSSVGALYNSSITAGASIGNVKLDANASISNAFPTLDNSKMLSTGNFDLNGFKLTITSGIVQLGGMQAITSGDIDINNGAMLYYANGGSLTNVTGTITVNAGGRLDTRDANNTAAFSVHTIALNGGILGNGLSVNNNGGGNGAILRNNITVDATNGGTISSVSSGFSNPARLHGSISGTGPLSVTNNGVEFRGDGSGYTGTMTATGGTVQFNTATNQLFSGNIAGGRPLTKSTAATTTTLTGNLSYSGLTTVASGTLVLTGTNTSASGGTTIASGAALKLDYSSNNNRKIPSGVLTLSGVSIELAGGSFADSVASTTLAASTSSIISRSAGTAVLNLGAITVNTSAAINFAQSGIARTTNANNALGILGTWATIGGSQFAMNDGTGLIVAATSIDLTRLSSGSKVIADGASNHVRFIEGTGSTGNFTLGSTDTAINTLTQSSEGGTSAATVGLAGGQTLALNGVVVGTGAGALTLGTASNLGSIKAAGTSIEFRDLAAAGITVNSGIFDGTGATTVTKSDPGTLTFTATNAYSGGTIVNAGTLSTSLGNTAGARFPFGSGAITANAGTTVRFFADSTSNAMSYINAINLNAATLTSEDAVQTYSGNIALTGANTVNVVYSAKDAIFTGIVSGAGSINKTNSGGLTLSNTNSYTGGTTLTAGTLKTTVPTALGAVNQSLTMNGGTLQLATDSVLSSKNVTVNASSTIVLDRATSGAGLTTSLGTVTFGNGFTLNVNKGANVSGGISTLNFTGFPQLGTTASSTTTFAVGQDVEVILSGNLSGTQAFARIAKSGAGTLTIGGSNTWWDPASNTGLVTISGGTVDLRSQYAMGDGGSGTNRIDVSMAAATTLRVATDTALANNANVTLTGTGATIVSDLATAGAGITNQFNVLSLAAHTLSVTGGSNVTIGTTQVNFNSAILTGNAVFNVVNPAAGNTNMLISGSITGNFTLGKTGSGTVTLQGANTNNGAVAVSGGTLNLSGAAGAIASSSGITLSNGGVLTLANTSAANNGNRIAGAFAMNSGTLNFTNNQGAVNYAETTGALSISGGINTIATSQAATGQTSQLIFASLARTAGTVNFIGTGLGTTVDTKNEIRFTTNPTLVNGIIGTWATVNGTDYATTTGANNSVVAYSGYTDVTRLSSGTKVIPNTATANIRITEGTGSLANITLASATTTISSLNQSISGGTSSATIDTAGQALAVNSILVSSGAGGLTIGSGTVGTLKSAATSLQVIENSSGGSTINSLITDGTGASSFLKSGSGTLTLTANNSYTGATTVESGILAVSVMANGGSPSGIGAAAVAQGNLVLSDGTLRYTGNTISSNRGFTINAGTTGTVDVSISAQTLTISGGIAATTGNLVKTGAGNLTLSGAGSHTGTTSVTGGGTLRIQSTLRSTSGIFVGSGAKIELAATNIFVADHSVALTDSRVLSANGGTINIVNSDARIGNISLANAATFTSDRAMSGYGWLLANTASGPATVSVSGTGASTMNGSGGLFMLGVQNFNIADVTTSAATDLTISMILGDAGQLGGTGGINKLGAGTMVFTGANSYTGVTNVSQGVLAIGAGGTTNASSVITVSNGATLRMDRNDTWGTHTTTTSSPIVINQGGTLASNTTFSTIVNPTINGGTITLNGGSSATLPALAIKGTLTVGGAAASTINVGTGTNNFINIGTSGTPGTLTVNVADATISSATDLTIGVVLQNNRTTDGTAIVASSLSKTGTGTMALTAANIYTGDTSVSQGVLAIGAGGTTSTSSTINVNNGGTLRFDRGDTWGNHTTTTSSPIVVNAGGVMATSSFNTIINPTLNGGIVTLNGGANASYPALAIKGTLTAGGVSASSINVGTGTNNFINIGPSGTAGTLIIDVADATASAATDLTINPLLQDNWNTAGNARIPSTLLKTGVGTLNLTGANTYSGGTTVTQGTLTVGTGGTLGAATGPLAVSNTNTGAGNAAILNLATAVNTTVGSLSGTIATPSGGTNTATINTQTGRTFTVNQAAAATFAGSIAGAGDFTLGAISTNTLTLTGANTYTGATTVSAGTLALVGGSQASPITVSSGASLGFTLDSPTTSTSSFNVTAGTIKITGTPTFPSYTLISSSTAITGTPTLDAAIPGYSLNKYGNTLVLETPAGTLYNTWAYANGATGGKAADTDSDGYINLMEYAFGTNPTVNSSGVITYSAGAVTATGQPVLEQDSGVYYAVFGRRTDYVAAGLTYTVEFTDGLSVWSVSGTTPTTVATDGTIDAVRVPFPNSIPTPSGPKKPTFFRVVITG